MPQTAPWRPMSTAPETAARLWLNHLTLGPVLVEARRGRWYAPSAAHQVWRWYRPAEPEGLEPFTGWLPFEAAPTLEEVGGAPFPGIPAASAQTAMKIEPWRTGSDAAAAPLP